MLLLSKGHHGMGLHVRPKVGSNVVAAGGVRLESEPKSTGELYSFTGKVTGTITTKNGNSQKLLRTISQTAGKEIFGINAGEEINLQHFAQLVGAPDGTTLDVQITDNKSDPNAISDNKFSVTFEIQVKDTEQRRIDNMKRTVFASIAEDGTFDGLAINQALFLSPKAPAGFGTDIFLQQVQHLSENTQIRSLQTHGVGLGAKFKMLEQLNAEMEKSGSGGLKEKPTIGYYIWPRLGYDAPLYSWDKGDMPDHLKNATTVRELMKMTGGAEWWKYNGSGREYKFDLHPNSESMQIATAYQKERKSRLASTSSKLFTARFVQNNMFVNKNDNNKRPLPPNYEGDEAPFDIGSKDDLLLDIIWSRFSR